MKTLLRHGATRMYHLHLTDLSFSSILPADLRQLIKCPGCSCDIGVFKFIYQHACHHPESLGTMRTKLRDEVASLMEQEMDTVSSYKRKRPRLRLHDSREIGPVNEPAVTSSRSVEQQPPSGTVTGSHTTNLFDNRNVSQDFSEPAHGDFARGCFNTQSPPVPLGQDIAAATRAPLATSLNLPPPTMPTGREIPEAFGTNLNIQPPMLELYDPPYNDLPWRQPNFPPPSYWAQMFANNLG
ncbi:hypothetical protein PG999_005620 [Apiospora kogelbergensis]|uniref:Uncharacterized protein n=1 Tax=Apiospora kogelbergensis TaxID=1337665 RepID=A0AAW0R2N4_9PEZI